MQQLTSAKLRSLFLAYFQQRGHAVIPGASVVPHEDPTALFTTAGMHPLVPYLMGRPHPAGKRLASAQPCIRTTDIDEVGDDTHLTCFEMLGNWSLGDYFKEESIAMSWDFLTGQKWLGIPPQKLAVTCYEGDEAVPRDTVAAAKWQALGVLKERIFFCGRQDNWWGPVGSTGPCGPDTEIFYWVGEDDMAAAVAAGSRPNTDSRFVEIWNNVFMEYDRRDDGTYAPLPQKNVDTGLGLERTVAILNGQPSVFATDAFAPILARIFELAGSEYPRGELGERAACIIADHIRAAVFIAAAGVVPGNTDRGYVLRRLIRRAVRFCRVLSLPHPVIGMLAETVIEQLREAYPSLNEERAAIVAILTDEERRFGRTVEKGLREFDKAALALPEDKKELGGVTVFRLYDTYGFPFEMTQELADERGLIVDRAGFEAAFRAHQEKSRTAAKGLFQSGLADRSEQVVRYHTATHLLHAALRRVLGEEVRQRGSNITAERLRFDFSYPQKMTDLQLKEVEEMVNEQIAADLSVSHETRPLNEALKSGALGFFGEKYPDLVTIYSIGDFSQEICTGPHVAHTGQLGQFKIIKEESAGAGLRRIKALLS